MTASGRHGRAWDAERCGCGSPLVGCQGCCEMRCLVCDPYSEYERINRCCTISVIPAAPNLDPYDAKRDAESEARYERDPQSEPELDEVKERQGFARDSGEESE